jgi:transcription antitermination factor NusG
MEQWYTLHIKPNTEYQVVRVLAQRQSHTYLPEEEKPQARQRHKPFFPCYLFARIDFNTVGFSSIQWIPGLRRGLSVGDQPTRVPDEIIEGIQGKLAEIEGTDRGLVPNFKPGDTVLITSGPFQDMLAIFGGPTTPARRVQVLLNILGHASRFQIEINQLAEAPEEIKVPSLVRPRGTRGKGRKINYNKWNC